MADLFNVDVRTISEHLQNIFQTNELDQDSTIRKIRIVQNEGGRDVSRNVVFYNLDAIIAVGYRVNSRRATQFRIWATQILKEYIIKGFVMNDERLKHGEKVFGKDYFYELLQSVKQKANVYLLNLTKNESLRPRFFQSEPIAFNTVQTRDRKDLRTLHLFHFLLLEALQIHPI